MAMPIVSSFIWAWERCGGLAESPWCSWGTFTVDNFLPTEPGQSDHLQKKESHTCCSPYHRSYSFFLPMEVGKMRCLIVASGPGPLGLHRLLLKERLLGWTGGRTAPPAVRESFLATCGCRSLDGDWLDHANHVAAVVSSCIPTLCPDWDSCHYRLLHHTAAVGC